MSDFFKNKKPIGKLDLNDDGQIVQRVNNMTKMVQDAFAPVMADQRVEVHGDRTIKVSIDQYKTMYQEWKQANDEGRGHDTGFLPFTSYAQDILCYADGSPRKTPLRPFLVNEVGMFHDKIVVLKDSMPGDKGEGNYHIVPANTPVPDKPPQGED